MPRAQGGFPVCSVRLQPQLLKSLVPEGAQRFGKGQRETPIAFNTEVPADLGTAARCYVPTSDIWEGCSTGAQLWRVESLLGTQMNINKAVPEHWEENLGSGLLSFALASASP